MPSTVKQTAAITVKEKSHTLPGLLCVETNTVTSAVFQVPGQSPSDTSQNMCLPVRCTGSDPTLLQVTRSL